MNNDSMFIMNEITTLAEMFIAHKNWSITTLGTYAAGDSRFFARLAQGRVTISQCIKVGLWLEQRWPMEIPWPLKNLTRKKFLLQLSTSNKKA